MDGLEQRYGVEGVNSREKALFDKLNENRKKENLDYLLKLLIK